jgi:hippurate hydrolase
MAAGDFFQIQLKGKGGHASVPHDAVDPIPVACEIVQALQTLVTRRIDVFDPVVLTVTQIEAGTTVNVIPESARLVGTLRSTSEPARESAQEGIRRVAAQVAAAHQVESDVVIVNGYPVTVNDAKFSEFARGVATDLLGEDGYVEMPSPMMYAEDFSFVLQKLPGAMVQLGVRPTEGEPAPVHSNRMLLNEEGMQAGIALNAAVALRYLE